MCRCRKEREILEVKLSEKLSCKDQNIQSLCDKITLLSTENSHLKEISLHDRSDVSNIETAKHEVEELYRQIERVREDSALKCCELERTVGRLQIEKDKILEQNVDKLSLLEERVEELEYENALLKRLRCKKNVCDDLEKKIQDLENDNKELVRARTQKERDMGRLQLELREVQCLLNSRDEKVYLAEKVGEISKFYKTINN